MDEREGYKNHGATYSAEDMATALRMLPEGEFRSRDFSSPALKLRGYQGAAEGLKKALIAAGHVTVTKGATRQSWRYTKTVQAAGKR